MKNTKIKSKADSAGGNSRSVLLLISALILVFCGIYIKNLQPGIFYETDTGSWSALRLTADSPYPLKVFVPAFFKIFGAYLKGYVLPSCVFVLSAILVFSAGLAGLKKKDGDFFEFLRNSRKEKIFIIVCFIFALLASLYAHFYVFGDYPAISDEFIYLFQADLLSSGKIYAEAPPSSDSFKGAGILTEGKWYSKATIGWPLLLALGKILRVEWIVAPLCAALSAIFLYLLAKHLSGGKGGAVAVICLLVSPFFVVLGGTYLSHSAAGLVVLVLLYSLMKTFESDRWIYPVAAGVSAALILMIRPGDGATLAFSLIPLVVYLAVLSKDVKKSILKIVPVFILAAAGAGLLLYVNYLQTGDPMVFGYQKYLPDDRWGFGAAGHTPLNGLWNAVYLLMRVNFWTIPFIYILSLLSIIKNPIRNSLLLLPSVAVVLFYIGYYDTGVVEYGSRYYYTAFIIALALVPEGISVVRGFLEKVNFKFYESFALSFVIISVFFMIFGVFWQLLPNIARVNEQSLAYYKYFANPPDIEGKSIVLLLPDGVHTNKSMFVRNYQNYKDEKNIVVNYLSPESNKRLADAFPDRKPYIVFYDKNEKKYKVMPGMNIDDKAMSCLLASRNYLNVFDYRKAEAENLRAISLDPDNPLYIGSLGNLYIKEKKYEDAALLYLKITGNPAVEDSAYLAGRCFGMAGKYKDAAKYLQEYINNSQNREKAANAGEWLEYFKKKSGRL